MAAHSQQPKSHTINILLIALAAAALLALVGVGVWYTLRPAGPAAPVTAPTESTPGTAEDTEEPTEPPTETLPVTTEEEPFVIVPGDYRLPENMVGAWLLPGVDWLKTDDPAAVEGDIAAALDLLEEWGFNTVILPLQTADGTPVWEALASDPLPLWRKALADREMYYMVVWDLGVYSGRVDPSVPAERKTAVDAFVAALAHGPFETVLFDAPGFAYKDTGDITAWQFYGNGMESAAYRRKCTEAYYTDCIKVLKENDPDTAAGLLTAAVWAHSSNDPRGSRTYSAYEEYTDGCADTLAWVQGGLADLVMVKNYNSTAHSSAAFSTTLNWWSGVCGEAEIPLYVSHAADKANSGAVGWTSPDQLSRQYLICQKQKACAGDAFHSLADLAADHQNSTTALRRAIAGDALSQYIGKELQLTAPASATLTTQSETIGFMGSADPNFPLTLNGEEIALSELGQFSVDRTLTPGNNVFTFVHKGETKVYTVFYDMQVLLSVAPTEDITLEGETVLTLSAAARIGSKVTAELNGNVLAMTATPTQGDEEGSDLPPEFEHYTASVTLPAGVIGSEQTLGAVKVTAVCKGVSKTLTGGKITVAALPEPPPVTEHPIDIPHVIGDLTLIDPGAGEGEALKKGQIMAIAVDYAEVFNGETVDDYSRPTNAYLPKGTTDVLVSTVYDAASKNYYYLLGSGARVYKSSASVYLTEGQIKPNAVTTVTSTIARNYTVLDFGCTWRVPYRLQLLPQEYSKPTTTNQPNYDISKTGQTTEYIALTFCYTDTVPDAPDLSASPLFSKAEWETVDTEAHTATLRLTLKKVGVFDGYSVIWNNEGHLVMSFRHPAAVGAGDKPLSGLHIVIDPGHGGNSSGTYGTIPKLYEKTLALDYSKLVQEKLEALGATIVMSRTDDTNPAMNARTDLARNNGTDLLVSIHMNGVTSGTASGCSIHYFNEYSYAAARAVTDAMREVEKAHETGNRSSPCAWSPFHMCRVHDCPAILVECGFMTNAHNMTLLVDPVYQEELTQAIVDGIVTYFRTRHTDTEETPTTTEPVTTEPSTVAPETAAATENA